MLGQHFETHTFTGLLFNPKSIPPGGTPTVNRWGGPALRKNITPKKPGDKFHPLKIPDLHTMAVL